MNEIVNLSLSEIVPGANDRTVFADEALRELASSIAEHGLIQPITVRQIEATDLYQIVCGERRTRAVKSLGWTEVPCIVRAYSDEDASAAMLSENVARASLDVIDEAIAYKTRVDRFGWTVKEIAAKAGVSQVHIQFRLKLLRLDPTFQDLLRNGHLPMGYAQTMSDAGLASNDQYRAMAALRENPTPTPAWFRRVVSSIAELSQQNTMLDDDFMASPILELTPAAAPIDPPTPATTAPPAIGDSARDIVSNQIDFWANAAAAWNEMGKNFKKAECEAAAQALRFTLQAI